MKDETEARPFHPSSFSPHPFVWSRRRDLNPQPFVYETNALSSLSYSAKDWWAWQDSNLRLSV